jgi:predicted P-loop ATPase
MYLRDETGGRRYWPNKAMKIDLDALRHDRDQLFAEAVHLYRAGTKWWPGKDFEEKYMKPEQDARYEGDVWEENIKAYIATKPKVTIGQVAKEALFFDTNKIGTHDQRRISGVLTNLGWRRHEKKDYEGKRWWSKA